MPRLLTIGALVFAGLWMTQEGAPQEPMTPAETAEALALDPSKIFTFFFVMLGPLKLLGPYAKLTGGMDERAARGLALRATLIACVGGIAAAVIGQRVLGNWGIAPPALLIAAGLVLLLVALQSVLAQYEDPAAPRAQPAAQPGRGAALTLAFPGIITPYGIAAFVLLMATAPVTRDVMIFGIFLATMAINLVFMWFARPILKHAAGVLQILGAVMGVLQVALAIQFMLIATRMLGLLPTA